MHNLLDACRSLRGTWGSQNPVVPDIDAFLRTQVMQILRSRWMINGFLVLTLLTSSNLGLIILKWLKLISVCCDRTGNPSSLFVSMTFKIFKMGSHPGSGETHGCQSKYLVLSLDPQQDPSHLSLLVPSSKIY